MSTACLWGRLRDARKDGVMVKRLNGNTSLSSLHSSAPDALFGCRDPGVIAPFSLWQSKHTQLKLWGPWSVSENNSFAHRTGCQTLLIVTIYHPAGAPGFGTLESFPGGTCHQWYCVQQTSQGKYAYGNSNKGFSSVNLLSVWPTLQDILWDKTQAIHIML